MQLGKGRCVAEVDYKTQQRKKIADLELLNPFSPPWVHDLPGTENYVIVPDTPVLISLKVDASLIYFPTPLRSSIGLHAAKIPPLSETSNTLPCRHAFGNGQKVLRV